jgi:hypothetical protein
LALLPDLELIGAVRRSAGDAVGAGVDVHGEAAEQADQGEAEFQGQRRGADTAAKTGALAMLVFATSSRDARPLTIRT